MCTVLVVDDEPLIRWSVGERLLAEGYDVVGAGTGCEAMERLRQGVDVVLLDCHLPDVNGVGVLHQISKTEPAVPVVLLTADTTPQTAREARALGACQVVTKPFLLDEIVRAVGQAFEKIRADRGVGEASSAA